MPHDNKNNEEQYFLKCKHVTTNATHQQDGELHESYPDKVVDLITTNGTEEPRSILKKYSYDKTNSENLLHSLVTSRLTISKFWPIAESYQAIKHDRPR